MATTVDTDEVQKLYDISAALDENVANFGSDAAKYEEMYSNILSLSKGGQKAKMLAAQFIPKYLVHFPKFADESINCLIDLCEEEDLSTRISAIRALPVIARNTPESLPKLADILGQLLQAELPVELDRVKQSLVSLLQQDLKGTLATLFTQATSEIEDLRVKAIAFIFEKVLPMRNEINATEDLQKFVSEHVKKVLPHVVSAKEFQMFIDLLSGLKIYTKAAIASELLDVLADIISTDESNTAKLITCLQAAAEFLQRKGANSAKFTGVLASTVLPAFGQLKELQQVELIHKMTDVVGHLNADDAKTLLPPLYELLLAHIPAADAPVDQEHKINFSIVESALYMFHVLAAKAPGSLRGLCGINVVTGQPSAMSTELAVDRKKELDARLKLLEETTSKNYVKPMEEVRKSLQKATTAEDTQKKKIIEISLKATHNILLLAKNLQSKNPTFGAVTNDIVLSFKLGKPVAKKQLPPVQSTATTIPKPAARVAKPAATTNATQSSGAARPAFGNVYVPPKRQQQQQQPAASKKREAEANTSSEPKKHKGRGSSKFQGLV